MIGLAAVAVLSHLVPKLFNIMLVAGSLYMMWIGYSLIRSRIEVDAVEGTTRKPVARIFGQAVMTCLINPKAWMFVVSVFPQFLKAEYGPLLPQAVAMGAITVAVQGAIYGGLALRCLEEPRFTGVEPGRDGMDRPRGWMAPCADSGLRAGAGGRPVLVSG